MVAVQIFRGKRQHTELKFWNFGPTPIWHNIECVFFNFSKLLHSFVHFSHLVF